MKNKSLINNPTVLSFVNTVRGERHTTVHQLRLLFKSVIDDYKHNRLDYDAYDSDMHGMLHKMLLDQENLIDQLIVRYVETYITDLKTFLAFASSVHEGEIDQSAYLLEIVENGITGEMLKIGKYDLVPHSNVIDEIIGIYNLNYDVRDVMNMITEYNYDYALSRLLIAHLKTSV